MTTTSVDDATLDAVIINWGSVLRLACHLNKVSGKTDDDINLFLDKSGDMYNQVLALRRDLLFKEKNNAETAQLKSEPDAIQDP